MSARSFFPHILKQHMLALTRAHRQEKAYSSFSVGVNDHLHNSADLVSKENNVDMKSISKAMKMYLKAIQYRECRAKRDEQVYSLGKRHLANIMSLDIEDLTAKDISNSLTYLFPCSLTHKLAKPCMPEPAHVSSLEKPKFSNDGRPFSAFFYTKRMRLNELMFEASEKLLNLSKFEESVSKDPSILHETSEAPYCLLDQENKDSEWLTFEEVQVKLKEKLVGLEYKQFLTLLKRMLHHRYSSLEQDYLKNFRKTVHHEKKVDTLPKIMKDANGELFSSALAKRKTGWARAILRPDQESVIKINDKYDILFFNDFQSRENILLPFIVTKTLGSFSVDLQIQDNPGKSNMAGASRLAIARALTPFISAENRLKLKLAGLLTPFMRTRERDKPGRSGARARHQWRKR